jgi:hypothetical protein
MGGIEMQEGPRKAGVVAAVLLAASAIMSFVAFAISFGSIPGYPGRVVLLAAIVDGVAAAFAAWLGRTVWQRGARWAAFVLLAWAVTKQVMPNLFYPSVLPKAFYMAAMSAAIVAVVRTRRAKA